MKTIALLLLLLTTTLLITALYATEQLGGATTGYCQDQNTKRILDENAGRDKIINLFGRLPLTFIENKGQFDEQVRFCAQSAKAKVYFTPTEVVFHFAEQEMREKEPNVNIAGTFDASGHNDPYATYHDRIHAIGGLKGDLEQIREEKSRKELAIRVSFPGANPDVLIDGEDELEGKISVFRGNDESKWLKDIPTYRKVTYHDLWPGIDLVYHGESEYGLKYDLIIKPGANPSQVLLKYEGHEKLSVNSEGELIIDTAFGPIFEKKPFIYQEIDGENVEINGKYETVSNVVGWRIENYDKSHPLIIDPGLIYSTFLDRVDFDYGFAIGLDNSGCAYLAGATSSSDFPTTIGAYDRSYNGGMDIFIIKINKSGTDLVYSTLLGGSDFDSMWRPGNIAVDASGCVYITGFTRSYDFPTTSKAFDRLFSGNLDAFVAKINASGSGLIYSTFLGGNNNADYGHKIAIDSSGCAYIAGKTWSYDFPITKNAYQNYLKNDSDIFVTKLSSSGTSLIYSTFLGGYDGDGMYGVAIAVDYSGNAYIAGDTYSSDFPVTPGAFNPSYSGGETDIFVTKFSTSGNSIIYSTFCGGSATEVAYSIDVDTSGCLYIIGQTSSSDFPTSPNAYDRSYNGGNYNVYVMKFNPSGTDILYSTYLGPGFGYGIAVDASGCAYLTGTAWSSSFPVTNGAYDTSHNGGGGDAFVTKLNYNGVGIIYSTFLGGNDYDQGYNIALDNSGHAFITGPTLSSDFPTTSGAFNSSGGSAFVTKLALSEVSIIVSPFSIPNDGTVTSRVTACIRGLSEVSNVRVDLLPIGGPSISLMSDDGQGGDQIAGDGVYTCLVSVNDSGIVGTKTIVVTVNTASGLEVKINGIMEVTQGKYFVAQYEKTIGIMRIRNEAGFRPSGADRWIAHGLCSIGTMSNVDLLMLDGEITLDQTAGNLNVSGNGNLYIPNVYLFGTIVLYEGSFSFDPATGLTKGLNALLSKLNIKGMKVEISSLQLTDSLDGVIISGKMELPKSLGSVKVDVGQFTISKSEGIDIDVTVIVPSIPIPGTSWGLNDVEVSINTYDDIYSGEGTLSIPALFDVYGNFVIMNGMLDTIGVELSGFMLPIDATPLSLTKLAGGVRGMSSPPIVITASARVSIAITEDFRLVDIDGSVEIGQAGYIKGTLKVTYLISEGIIKFDGFELGELTVAIGKAGTDYEGLSAEGWINLLGLFHGEGKLRVHLDKTFQGRASGTFSLPWWLGGATLDSVVVLFNNSGAKCVIPINWFSIDNVGAKFDRHFPYVHFLVNTNTEAMAVRVGMPSLGIFTRQLATQTFILPAGRGEAIFKIRWSQGDADIIVHRPGGATIDPKGSPEHGADYDYFKDPDSLEAVVIVKNPEAGAWTVEIPDDDGIGLYFMELLSLNGAPTITVTKPSAAIGPASSYKIQWKASDPDDAATVSLFYDNNNIGANGSLIVGGLSKTQTSYTWKPTAVPSGTYYVYALIDDGKNPPSASYGNGAIKIVNKKDPSKAPVSLKAIANDNSLWLSWGAPKGVKIAGYRILYSTQLTGSQYENYQDVGNITEHLLTGLMNGMMYRIAVVGYDSNGRETPISASIKATPATILNNHAPVISSKPGTYAVVGVKYSYSVKASDAEKHPIRFGIAEGPEGMMIGIKSGIVTWTPTRFQKGAYNVQIIARDITSAICVQTYVITVDGDLDYDGIGDSKDKDRDGDGKANIIDPMPDDTDNDGISNADDTDDDNDGVFDADEVLAGTNPCVRDFGSLKVVISPKEAVNGGARWCVDGGSWLKSGYTQKGLSLRPHTVSYNTITGWGTPVDKEAIIKKNKTTTITGTYYRMGSLQVSIYPPEVVIAGAASRVDEGEWQDSDYVQDKLAVGNHTVEFADVAGWDKPSNLTAAIVRDKTTHKIRTYKEQSPDEIRLKVFLQNNNLWDFTYWNIGSDGIRRTWGYLFDDSAENWSILGAGLVDDVDDTYDLIVKNALGEVAIWYMNADGTRKAIKSIGKVSSKMQYGGCGDIDRDGIVDMIWHIGNKDGTGTLQYWLMKADGTLKKGGTVRVIDPHVSVRAIGDIDGDGSADIVTRYDKDYKTKKEGDLYIWFLKTNGTVRTSFVIHEPADTSVISAGRIGDSGAIIVRHKDSNPANDDYVDCCLLEQNMNGGFSLSSVAIDYIPKTWRIGTSGEIDGNNGIDLIWESETTGGWYCWFWLLNPDGTLKKEGVVVQDGIGNPELISDNWMIRTGGK